MKRTNVSEVGEFGFEVAVAPRFATGPVGRAKPLLSREPGTTRSGTCGSAGASPHCCEHVDRPCRSLRRKVGECHTAWNSAQLRKGFEKMTWKRMATKERKGTQKGRQKTRTERGAGHREPICHHSQRASSGRKASFFASFAFFRGHPPKWLGQLNHLHSSGFALPSDDPPPGKHSPCHICRTFFSSGQGYALFHSE